MSLLQEKSSCKPVFYNEVIHVWHPFCDLLSLHGIAFLGISSIFDSWSCRSQILADLENHALFKDDLECQKLILEAMKYHLLPERRTLMQSPRTKPRKSTVGTLYAVGGMDNNKGISVYLWLYILHFLYQKIVKLLSEWGCLNQSRNAAKTFRPMEI